MDGIIILNKEKGMTSNDCVIKLKKILHVDKIGHTGTLDPEVTGVLPICLGKATKLVDIMMDHFKTYLCTICIGIETETEDIYGKEIRREKIDKLVLGDVLASFKGDYLQTPPMYSALKYQGKRLYEYARMGIEVKREPRCMYIEEIDLVEDVKIVDDLAYFTFRVTGSKGLYVRTLCTDIAKRLGHIGCMYHLVREKTGPFSLCDAATIDDVKQGNFHIITLPEYFSHNEEIYVSDYMAKMVKNGIILDERQIVTDCPFKVYHNDELIAIYRPFEKNKYRPLIIF